MPVVSDHTAILTQASWNGIGVAEHPLILTYSFNTVAPDYLDAIFDPAFPDSLQPFTIEEQEMTRLALQAWADASGITFIEVPSGQGDIQFGKYDFHFSPIFAGAFAYFPSTIFDGLYGIDQPISGDIFVNQFDGVQFHEIIHEIGHALGFKHPFEGDITLDPAMDRAEFTVMSYQAPNGEPNGLGSLDIAAVQYVYGVQAQDGSHVESWSWDAVTLTLTQTGTSGADRIRGVFTSDIISGAGGDDLLFGAQGADTIDGGDGQDSLLGGDGDDTLAGGAGNDFIRGGAGVDTATYYNATSGVVVVLTNLFLGQDTLGAGVDTIVDIENLTGSAFNDILTGGFGTNVLLGNAGNDTLLGGPDADVLDGGADVDTVSYAGSPSAVIVNLTTSSASGGDAEGDTLSGFENATGSSWNDTLIGNAVANTLFGGENNDTLTGGAGADSISGGDGDDIINYNFGDGVDASIDGGTGTDRIVTFGNAGGETLDVRWNGTSFTFWKGSTVVGVEQGVADMGGGVDWLRNHNSSVGVSVNLALGTATGFISIANIENAWGSAFADTLTGSAVANIIRGGAGDDSIDGGGDNDTLVGDDGIDTILGGSGADTIYGLSGADIINAGDDNDTIYYSFGEGVDAIDGGLGTDTIICQGNSGAETLEVIWNGASFTFFKGGTVTSIEQATVDMGLGGDWLRYTGSSASISINLTTNAASGFTSIANIENAGGGAGADTITGSAVANNLIGNDGADQIDGAAGNDTLNGGAGADRLTGGADSDTLTGGADSDTFVFATGSGADTINDFDADSAGGQDFIDLTGYGVTAIDFATRVTIADQGANTLITIDGINTIILNGVTGDGANLITQTDFILGP